MQEQYIPPFQKEEKLKSILEENNDDRENKITEEKRILTYLSQLKNGEKPDAYIILGIPVGSSKDEIKKRYRELIKLFHPDLHRDDPDKLDISKCLNTAYAQIK
ncbi:MAG: J domain-containing protein [Candidatus Magasanikbacteria bacterium]